MARKLIVYVEGETDEKCLRGWAEALGSNHEFASLAECLKSVAFVYLSGGSAETMIEQADQHFRGCKLLSETAQRLLVLDRNDGKWQNRVAHDPLLKVWRKKHVESYLLVPAAWKRAVSRAAEQTFALAAAALENTVDAFFQEQSGGAEVNWLNPTQQAFQDIDAKKMLFEARKDRDGYDALASKLYDTPMPASPFRDAARHSSMQYCQIASACKRVLLPELFCPTISWKRLKSSKVCPSSGNRFRLLMTTSLIMSGIKYKEATNLAIQKLKKTDGNFRPPFEFL